MKTTFLLNPLEALFNEGDLNVKVQLSKYFYPAAT